MILLLIAVTLAIANQAGETMQWMIQQETQLLAFQRNAPIAMFLLSFVAYFTACFIPGTNGKSFIAGWLLGLASAALVINVSSTLAALAMFIGARRWMRSSIESRYAMQLPKIQERIEADGGVYLLTLRLVPLMPYAPLNLLMGVTPMRAKSFWWATQLGLLPSNLAYAWLGSNLPGLSQIAEMTWRDVLTKELAIAITIVAVCQILLARTAKRMVKRRSAPNMQ